MGFGVGSESGAGGWPALAQSVDTEPVFLDGLFLFDVPGASDLTAVERAGAIETNLLPVLESGEPIIVQVELRSPASGNSNPSTPVIFANDRYIMTVTQADAKVGGAVTPKPKPMPGLLPSTEPWPRPKTNAALGF